MIRFPTQADTLAWVRSRFPDKCSPLDRAAKLCEEAGEVIGAVIKISEGRKTIADVAQETAQVTICAMALAEAVGFDLWAEVVAEYARASTRFPKLGDDDTTYDKLANAVADAIGELEAEHYRDPELKGRGGCVMCWPKDGSWPCTSRMVADGLREALEGMG